MIACKKTRLTEAGNIVGHSAMLHWILFENTETSAYSATLNDATSSTTGEVIKLSAPASTTIVIPFDPPMPFLIGIRISAFGHANVRIVGGYTD